MNRLSQMTNNFYLEFGYTQEGIDALAPQEYTPYTGNGDYLKCFYDVKMKDGTEYINIYPNAGVFHVSLKNGAHRRINFKDIYEFRLSQDKEYSEEPDESEFVKKLNKGEF